MSSVVLIMDEGHFRARTDVIVVVDPAASVCTWVPRDLWSPCSDNRINVAFAKGGHALVVAALAEHGLSVEQSLCFSRGAIGRCLDSLAVTVPVSKRTEFDYPLQPTALLEDGSKRIVFNPPQEHLSGERIHQWVGARKQLGGQGRGGDLGRIVRQQTLVRCLLKQGADLSRVLDDPGQYQCTDLDFVLGELACVTPAWTFETFDPMLQPRVIRGMQVLVNPECA